jgi:Arabinose-binding domain of AraC transcription regulator, N-term
MSERPAFGGHILAMVTRSLLRVAEVEGLDAAALLTLAGLSREAIANPDARVPIERHVALGVAMTERLGPVNGGLHSGAAIYGDPNGALGFGIRRSGQHGRALERFRRFLAITNDSLWLSSAAGDEGVRVSVDMVSSLAALGHPTEALFSAWVAISRFATGVRWTPVRVAFRHQPWGPVAEHREFFDCPVQFGARDSVLIIDAHCLALPIHSTEHRLDGTLDRLRDRLTTADPPATPPTATQAAISDLIDGLRAGPIENRADHAPPVLARAAALLLSGAEALPAFEVAFLLGFTSVPELLASTGQREPHPADRRVS